MPHFQIIVPLVGKYRGLHCTVVPTFRSQHSARRIIQIVENVLVEFEGKIVLTSMRRAIMGKSDDVPVYEIEPTQELQKLHEALCSALERGNHGFITQKEVIYSGFRPHVSDKENIRFPPGVQQTAACIQLSERVGNGKSVVRCT